MILNAGKTQQARTIRFCGTPHMQKNERRDLSNSPESNGMEEGQLLLEPHHQGFGIRRLFSKVCETPGGH